MVVSWCCGRDGLGEFARAEGEERVQLGRRCGRQDGGIVELGNRLMTQKETQGLVENDSPAKEGETVVQDEVSGSEPAGGGSWFVHGEDDRS